MDFPWAKKFMDTEATQGLIVPQLIFSQAILKMAVCQEEHREKGKYIMIPLQVEANCFQYVNACEGIHSTFLFNNHAEVVESSPLSARWGCKHLKRRGTCVEAPCTVFHLKTY